LIVKKCCKFGRIYFPRKWRPPKIGGPMRPHSSRSAKAGTEHWQTRKPSWRWQTCATQKDAKIAPIWRVSFHFTEFHLPKFQIRAYQCI